ncbi:E3 ubiquitin-protein ligase huwe1, partial [Homalodisca vitripennis]
MGVLGQFGRVVGLVFLFCFGLGLGLAFVSDSPSSELESSLVSGSYSSPLPLEKSRSEMSEGSQVVCRESIVNSVPGIIGMGLQELWTATDNAFSPDRIKWTQTSLHRMQVTSTKTSHQHWQKWDTNNKINVSISCGIAVCHLKQLDRKATVRRGKTIDNVNMLLEELVFNVAKRNSYSPREGRPKPDIHETVLNSTYSLRIAGNLHLFMLLFEEIRVPCAKVVHSTGLLSVLIRLMAHVTEFMGEGDATPKWMAPLLLLIDLLEKVSVCVNRKIEMHKVTTHIWRWLDLASGKWSLYMPNNNKLINEAYWRGDRDVTITSGRRRYTIAFASMCQINDDSGKARPVMMTLVEPKESLSKSNYENQPTEVPAPISRFLNLEDKDPNDTVESLSEPEYYVDFFHRRFGLERIAGVDSDDIEVILRSCMQLISKPVDADTLHAVMQLCVRFTRDYAHARYIAELGVVTQLLKLTQASAFTGFVGLATMLIRHILEEPANITAAIERV